MNTSESYGMFMINILLRFDCVTYMNHTVSNNEHTVSNNQHDIGARSAISINMCFVDDGIACIFFISFNGTNCIE